MDLLMMARVKFEQILIENNLLHEDIKVSVRGLSPQEAIGITKRQDFPIVEGKEIMIESEFRGSYGQAFTSVPVEYKGTLEKLINSPIEKIENRALLVAVLNSVLRSLNLADKTTHCKDDEPEKCSIELINWLKDKKIEGKLGLIGFQPAMLENISNNFNHNNILISDLNSNNISKYKFGIKVLDGNTENFNLIDDSDFILITGSTIVNGSINKIYEYLEKKEKSYTFFGNTISGVAKLVNLPHICFFGR
jgi:uncharacterized protein (DUF4213/DUF364 family)